MIVTLNHAEQEIYNSIVFGSRFLKMTVKTFVSGDGKSEAQEIVHRCSAHTSLIVTLNHAERKFILSSFSILVILTVRTFISGCVTQPVFVLHVLMVGLNFEAQEFVRHIIDHLLEV